MTSWRKRATAAHSDDQAAASKGTITKEKTKKKEKRKEKKKEEKRRKNLRPRR
jgi:ribosomal protein L12E/L44/L45/RPP1/RPP2